MDDCILKSHCETIEKSLSDKPYKEWAEVICGILYRTVDKDSMNCVVRRKIKNNYLGKCDGRVNKLPHHYYWEKEKISYAFTNIGEIDEKYIHRKDNLTVEVDEEQRKKQERERNVRSYCNVINNDFNSYYTGIAEAIEGSSAFFEEDLKYIMLNAVNSYNERMYELNEEEIIELEDKYDFLHFPEATTKKQEKYQEILIQYLGKLLAENVKFPLNYKSFVDTDEKCIRIRETNNNFLLSFLFYPEFRSLYKKKNPNCNIKNIWKIIDNIHTIDTMSETDSTLFPFMAERLTGVNLCMQFSKYYNLLSQEEVFKYNKDIECLLIRIFNLFLKMPNIFSRIQIMREFMEPVIFFNRETEKQLILINNLVSRLVKNYIKSYKKVLLVIKKQKLNEDKEMQCLQGLESGCRGIDYFKNIDDVLSVKTCIFVKEYGTIRENRGIYEMLQKEVFKSINLYYSIY